MRKDEKHARILGLFIGFAGSLGGIGCIVTGLRFDEVSITAVAVFCLAAAVIAATLTGRRLLPFAVAGFFLAGLWSWWKGGLALSAEAFLNHISYLYNHGYGWGIIRWSTQPLAANMAQPILCALGILLALGICWSFLKCRSIWLTAALISAPVIPCMILTDTVPAAPYLFIQLFCLILLLMVRLARKRRQDTALMPLLALPVALALLVLFICIPEKTYTSFAPVDRFLGHIQEFFTDSGKETPQTPVRQESQWIDLSDVGPKRKDDATVMEILPQQTGLLYLKGAAYDTYRSTWWDSAGATYDTYLSTWRDSAGITADQFFITYRTPVVRITTKAIHDVLYLPYGTYAIPTAPTDPPAEKNGRVDNPGGWTAYTVLYTGVPAYDESWQQPATGLSRQFTQLPAQTLREAQAYLDRELPELQAISAAAVWTRAQAIVSHVSRSAQYSLQTRKMPGSSDDFALWFLEESDTGYCIHFASAATVLLRAAGIPTRYVTGYLVNARSDTVTEVTEDNAHAWVECYINGVGWVPLEPTPGNGVANTAGSETTPPAETQQSESTETTGSTQPPETTEPAHSGETTESTVPPSSTTVPPEDNSDIGGADGPGKQPWVMPPWLKWGLGMPCAAGAVIGQWRLRVMLRQKKRSRGRRNAQALARWQEVVLHCRVRKEEPDSKLLSLAQKARFSHHTVTREELREFDHWLSASVQTIRQLSLWKRLLATLILALY